MTAPLAWLIDTNVVSEMMRPRPDPRVAAFLDSIAGEGLGLSSVTVWEVLDGIGRINPGRRRRDLADRFQDLLDELFEDRIIDWSQADAQACARIMEDKRRRGEPLDDHVPDALPCSGGGDARTCNRDPEHGRVPQHRNRDRRSLGC